MCESAKKPNDSVSNAQTRVIMWPWLFLGDINLQAANLYLEILIMAILGTPPKTTPPSNKRLIAGLIKGNQWLIHPDHKADYFLGGVARIPMV